MNQHWMVMIYFCANISLTMRVMQLDAKYEYFFGIKLVSSKLKMISGITPSSEDSTEEAIQCMKVFRRRMQMRQRIRFGTKRALLKILFILMGWDVTSSMKKSKNVYSRKEIMISSLQRLLYAIPVRFFFFFFT